MARAVLRDHGVFRSGLGVQWQPIEQAGMRATFIENDPPAHTRVRRAVQKWCTPRAIGELSGTIDAVVEPLIDQLVDDGGGDVMSMLARPVPLAVMSAWLGLQLPTEATSWADASFRLGAPDPPADAEVSMGGFIAWALSEGLAAVEPDGFAAAILAGGDHGDLVDDEPFIALASIIIAGLDTTVHLIGNGIAALAEHPEQLAMLHGDPAAHAPGTVEEVLRYDAPVRFFLRRTDDGRSVVVLYGAANRDERAFADADAFRIDRDASAAPCVRHRHPPVPRRAARPPRGRIGVPNDRRAHRFDRRARRRGAHRLRGDPRVRHAARPRHRPSPCHGMMAT